MVFFFNWGHWQTIPLEFFQSSAWWQPPVKGFVIVSILFYFLFRRRMTCNQRNPLTWMQMNNIASFIKGWFCQVIRWNTKTKILESSRSVLQMAFSHALKLRKLCLNTSTLFLPFQKCREKTGKVFTWRWIVAGMFRNIVGEFIQSQQMRINTFTQ